MFSLTMTHLAFECEALTPLRLSGFGAGAQLRGALGGVMRRAYCAATDRDGRSDAFPDHADHCPVCWLLAADEHPGEERRGYTLVPMARPPERYQTGDRFTFGISLFGAARRFLPYFILAIPEMGRLGIGLNRGMFRLCAVRAVHPLTGEVETILAEGDTTVHFPQSEVDHMAVLRAADGMAMTIERTSRLGISFVTPMRLIEDGRLVKAPDFGVLFSRLLDRLDRLHQQFADGPRRPEAEVRELRSSADRVRLIEARTRWVELRSQSSRTGQATPTSGFVGTATFAAPLGVWLPLLPWLIWGQGTQVGKDTAKGHGRYEIVVLGVSSYARWIGEPGRAEKLENGSEILMPTRRSQGG